LVRARNPRIWKETKREGETNTKGKKRKKQQQHQQVPGELFFALFLLYFMGPLDERKGKRFQSGLANKKVRVKIFSVMAALLLCPSLCLNYY
jgi:hypothetical protein